MNNVKNVKAVNRVNSVVLAERGVTLQYVEQGDPAGVPMILLHGVTDSWRSFEPVLPYLPKSIRAFAITQRGHGDSSRPGEGYRYVDFSEDVRGFMNVLNLPAAVIVGHARRSPSFCCRIIRTRSDA